MTAAAVPSAWAHLPFWSSDWPAIATRLRQERRPVLPPEPLRFAALELTPPEAVRVVILGQDPYPTPGHATGLAFSVPAGLRPLPRSLSNIFKELYDDLEVSREDGDLTFWARQGVMLLNAALSVPAGAAGGHRRLGWDRLARQVLAEAAARRPCAFVLWGAAAQALAGPIAEAGHRHLVLRSAHPSPLSARRGFFGSRPFSAVNAWLASRGEAPIAW
jgi:uracil-DNA glycosylase